MYILRVIPIFCLSLVNCSFVQALSDPAPASFHFEKLEGSFPKSIRSIAKRDTVPVVHRPGIDTAVSGLISRLQPIGRVSDFELFFSKAEVSELDSIVSQFEKETSIEVAILTIDSNWTNEDTFDSLVAAIHNSWGVGKRNLNNGIVIGISFGLRTIRISNGYGIEGKLNDLETKNIIDEIFLPAYKAGKYFEGTKNGLLAIMKKVR